MNPERVLKTFFDIVRIDSPSRSEAQLAAYCHKALEALGFEVHYDDSREKTGSDVGNLIAFLPGTNLSSGGSAGTSPQHIVLCAHMDCANPCRGVEPVIRDGVVYSAGETVLGADDKVAIAAIIEALVHVLEVGAPRPDVTVLLTVCEELSLLGARAVADDLFDDEPPCFIFDANGAPGTVVARSPFHYTVEADFTGLAAHAGVEPEAGKSAIRMAARAIENMQLGRLDEVTTANIGMVAGGVEVNVVPERCAIRGECRSFCNERARRVRDDMLAACSEAARAFGGTVASDWTLDYPGLLHTEADPLIISVFKAARSVGLEPKTIDSGGGSDANILATKGMRAVTLSTGMTSFHSTSEYVSVRHIEETALLVEALIAQFA